MIKEIDFNTIKYYWRKYLWPDYLKIKKIDLTTFDEYSYKGLRNINQKLGELILSPTYIAYIIDGEIVGTESGYKTNKDYYRIRGLWVHENYRRKGIATKLINYLENKSKEKYIWTVPRNTALPFYIKNNFIITGKESENNFFAKKLNNKI